MPPAAAGAPRFPPRGGCYAWGVHADGHNAVAEPLRGGVVMTAMRHRAVICLSLVVLAGACGGATETLGRAATASRSATPAPSREPADLPRFAEEQPVVDALSAGGIRVELVAGSKAETLLGAARRARVFIGTLAGS